MAYSIAAEDYEALPLFVPIKENRLLDEFFLYVLEDLHTTQGLGASNSPVQTLHLSRRRLSVSTL